VRSRAAAFIAAAGVVALAFGLGFARGGGHEFPRQLLATGGGDVAFVDDASCGTCHAAERAAWSGSHHARAMRPATDATVAGNFDDAAFAQFGVTTRFYRRDGRFIVNTEGPLGALEDYEVVYTFGVEPLQQYLVVVPGGRLQALTIAWDTERGTWFSLYPDERIAPDDPLHWTGRYFRWNDRCAECHSTDLRVGFDTTSDTYETTWAAVNVGCQACHGPGARHVAWARTADASATDLGLVVRSLEPTAQVWACAGCHSRRSRASAEDAHGRDFFDNFSMALLREGLYHADGQIDDEVYETGSFVQSLMYRRGVGCGDCHDAHSGTLLATGNTLCTRCHQLTPPAAFPTLRAGEYDTPGHHNHLPGSAGAACVDCHMPERVYMVVDGRRDHGLRVPRPDLAVAHGTPDACTMCHEDRTPAWAVAAIDAWVPDPARPDHFGAAIAAGRAGETGSAEKLLALAVDTTQPGIARATAISLIPDPSSERALPAIRAALVDADPLVRLAAVEAAAMLPAATSSTMLPALLVDPVGAVRIAAARILAPSASAITDPAHRHRLDREIEAYRDVQHAQADQPEAHQNLGSLAASLADVAAAEHSYRSAIALDSAFVPAYLSLATLHNRLGRNAEAELVLRHALRHVPDDGELHYSLGLLLAEMQRMTEAANALGTAAAMWPDRPRVHYNHGLALQAAGRMAEAEAALRRAYDLAPEDPDYVTGLVFLYRASHNRDRAVMFAQRLVALLPDEAGARQLLHDIEAERQP
jgi:predicted CXXCH cytochrome family protein